MNISSSFKAIFEYNKQEADEKQMKADENQMKTDEKPTQLT